MDRYLIEACVGHIATTPCERAGRRAPNQFPVLSAAVRTLCERDRAAGAPKFAKIAEGITTILRDPKKGFAGSAEFDPKANIKDRAAKIGEVLKNMATKATHPRLAPVLLGWMWERDEAFTRDFLIRECGFDLDTAIDSVASGARPAGIQSHSEYTLEGQITLAHSRLILIAQNHWHLISTTDRNGSRYWPMLRAALLRGVDIDIVAMHRDVGPRGLWEDGDYYPSAIAVWSAFMHTAEIPKQVEHCWTTLAEWEQEYRILRETAISEIGAFRAFGSYLNPMTIAIIDPEHEAGVAILSPRTSDPRAGARPHFTVHRSDRGAGFDYYWSHAEKAISDQHWVKMIG